MPSSILASIVQYGTVPSCQGRVDTVLLLLSGFSHGFLRFVKNKRPAAFCERQILFANGKCFPIPTCRRKGEDPLRDLNRLGSELVTSLCCTVVLLHAENEFV